MARASLGSRVAGFAGHDASLLRALPRRRVADAPPWVGEDRWRAWELSWLAADGRPERAVASISFAHDTPRLIESKSLKQYLNALYNTRFDSAGALRATLLRDLSAAAGGSVSLRLAAPALAQLPGECIDSAPLGPVAEAPSAALLRTAPGEAADHSLHSQLLRSLCPLSGQPDWASLWVRYSGPVIVPASLLAYVLSMRHWPGFQEHCVERMFTDIQRACQPERLLVSAFYLRRGGLDINPWRASPGSQPPAAWRLWWQ